MTFKGPFQPKPFYDQYPLFSHSSRGLGYCTVLPWQGLCTPTFAFFSYHHTCNFLPGNVPQACIRLLSLFPLRCSLFSCYSAGESFAEDFNLLWKLGKGALRWKVLRAAINRTDYAWTVTELGGTIKPVCATARPLSFPLAYHHSAIQ